MNIHIKNKRFALGIIAAVIIIGALFIWKNSGRKVALFICPDGKSITATFYIKSDTHVDLKLSDGRKLSVPRTISASGARYANADESFVFWNKGDGAFITENGTTTYADCVTTAK